MAGSKEGESYWADKRVSVVTDPTWGDNGKGKIVDAAAQHVKMGIRYNGGPNAGHTAFNEKGEKFILHGIPTVVLSPDVLGVVANSSYVNPIRFKDEIINLRKRGVEVTSSNLLISHDSHLIMPWHRMRDGLQEKARGGDRLGTTGQGIGPTASDRAARVGFRVKDLLDSNFEEKLDKELLFQERLSRLMDGEPLISEFDKLALELDDVFNSDAYGEMVKKATEKKYYDRDEILEQLYEAREIIAPMVTNVLPVIWDYQDRGERIVGEAGQGALLDLDSEAFPYVTSSHPTAAGFTMATGIQGKQIDRVIGVAKAYSTRVGEGPMPSELDNELGRYIQNIGEENGSTTGRIRRVGWFDGPATRRGIRIGGVESVALTKTDVLDELDEIGICVAYKVDGREYKDIPTADPDFMWKAEPVIEYMPGWRQKTTGIKNFKDLPDNEIKCMSRIQDVIGKPIEIVTNGPERESIIYRES